MNVPDEARSPIPPEVATRIKLVIFDVDGVLTDGGVYVGESTRGEPLELKRFDIQDGLGLKMLVWAGIEVALVSGRISAATAARAEELGITECHQDAGADKLPVLESLMARKSVAWEEVAMLADDLPDLPVFARVGLPAAVANAQPEILERALWRTRYPGGRGAAREFCRELLRARGQWEQVVGDYLGARGGVG